MVEIILKDKKKIVPCSVFLQGEYGIRDLFVGVPVKLGARGVEQIIQIKLTAEEDAALKKSAAAGEGTDRRDRRMSLNRRENPLATSITSILSRRPLLRGSIGKSYPVTSRL